ncbi:MAG TPA: hypothetical protein PLB96_08725 [Syntrophales bacterium]|nr:hypothetical protein [Syntrophales bacterium]
MPGQLQSARSGPRHLLLAFSNLTRRNRFDGTGVVPLFFGDSKSSQVGNGNSDSRRGADADKIRFFAAGCGRNEVLDKSYKY